MACFCISSPLFFSFFFLFSFLCMYAMGDRYWACRIRDGFEEATNNQLISYVANKQKQRYMPSENIRAGHFSCQARIQSQFMKAGKCC
jgi:hypothetical protein